MKLNISKIKKGFLSDNRVNTPDDYMYPNRDSSNDKFTRQSALVERGVTGIRRVGGFIRDDTLPELHGAQGAIKFRMMMDNDPICAAIIFAYKNIIRQIDWSVQSAGMTRGDRMAKEFLESCFDDMEKSWNLTLSDIITFLEYGYSLMEINYKVRTGKKDKYGVKTSKYTDGRIGWADWCIRSPETLYKWEYDDTGRPVGFVQIAAPDYRPRYIPLYKVAHFVNESNRGNPEGRSILRGAYRSSQMKMNFENIEGVGAERDIGGIPKVGLPGNTVEAGLNPNAPEEDKAALDSWQQFAANVRMGEQTSVIIPTTRDKNGNPEYTFDLLSNGNTTKLYDLDAIIKRYNQLEAMTVLCDFLLLGNNSQGSYALSSDKTALFKTAVNTILDNIEETINRTVIPKLFDLNYFPGMTDIPKWKHGTINTQTMTEIMNFVKGMKDAGFLTDDEETNKNMANYLLSLANLPTRSDFENTPNMKVTSSKNKTDKK